MHILYLKTHNITGKHYLGYYGPTNQRKFENYKGSGKYWKQHYKKHGYDVTTEVLCQASTSVERDGRLLAPEWFDKVCLEFSKMYDVVNNPSFANLVHETGSIGTVLGYKHTQETKDANSKRLKGTKRKQSTKDKIGNSHLGRKNTQEAKDRMSDGAKKHRQSLTAEERKELYGHERDDEWRQNQSKIMKGKMAGYKNPLVKKVFDVFNEMGMLVHENITASELNKIYGISKCPLSKLKFNEVKVYTKNKFVKTSNLLYHTLVCKDVKEALDASS